MKRYVRRIPVMVGGKVEIDETLMVEIAPHVAVNAMFAGMRPDHIAALIAAHTAQPPKF